MKNTNGSRAALYARVSTTEQSPDLQLEALRAHAAARGWAGTEFVDHGVSGAKEHRPALDALLKAVRRRTVDVVAVTKLDRLARSIHHLLILSKEFEALGVDLVVLDQAIDTTTSVGRLLFHVLAAMTEFERDLIRDRIIAGVQRARALGHPLGRPLKVLDLALARQCLAEGTSLRATARRLGTHATTLTRRLA